MKRMIFAMLCVLFVLSCVSTQQQTNPLLQDFDTPFGAPPFEQIKEAHYLPAIQEGIRQQKAEIDAIVN
ncbi:hypothetical protein JXO59_01460, partial [candidate division KSB1 bacterium]|nr:hypothetical protein [candidate division KSB1 bacterium]